MCTAVSFPSYSADSLVPITSPQIMLIADCVPRALLIPAAYLATCLAARATTEWVWHKSADGLHPDGNEQQMMWLMNRARANPTAEGQFLSNTGDPHVESDIASFRVDLPKMQAEFATYAPRPPAAFDRRLYDAALQHDVYLIATQSQNHLGQFYRVVASGFKFATWAGNVFSYANSALHAHAAFNIDWGISSDGMQPGRGHRAALMSLPAVGSLLSNVGIAVAPDALPRAGPFVVTINYAVPQAVANQANRFIVGTVWSDSNNNGRYDPGEGKGGVTVQPASGNWHAVTAAGGGYAIPVDQPGDFQVTFSGGGFGAPVQRSVTVGNESALLDVMATPAVALKLDISRVPTAAAVMLTWSGGNPPYQVQVSSNVHAGTWQNFGVPSIGTSLTVPRSTTAQYFRVVGSP
jgi:hypothetical protein